MHFDLGSLLPFVGPLLGIIGTAIGGLVLKRLHTPTDHDRAVILAHIADGAAALVASLNPKQSWPDLLKAVVTAIESAAGLPTSNAGAIERAAAAALVKLGKAPGQ